MINREEVLQKFIGVQTVHSSEPKIMSMEEILSLTDSIKYEVAKYYDFDTSENYAIHKSYFNKDGFRIYLKTVARDIKTYEDAYERCMELNNELTGLSK